MFLDVPKFAFLSMILLAPACGDDGGSGVEADGAIADGASAAADAASAIDAAADPDATVPGSCGVRVFLRISAATPGTPVVGLPVAFHSADGVPISATTTDASGEALFASCGSGTMITFVDPRPLSANLRTFAGVMPGQTVVFDGDDGDNVSVQVTTDADAQPAGGVKMRFSSPCATATTFETSASVTKYWYCPVADPTTFDVLVTSLDSQGTRLGFASARDVPLASPPITAAAGPWTAVASHDVELVNLPLSGLNNRRVFFGLSMNGYDGIESQNVTLAEIAASAQLTFAVPATPIVDGLWVQLSASGGLRSVSAGTLIAGVPSNSTVDYAAIALPPISSAGILLADPARPTVSVVVDGDMSMAHGGEVLLAWNDGTSHYWSLTFPGGLTSVQFPALPESMAALAPTETSTFYEPTSVSYWRATGVTYAEMVERGKSSANALRAQVSDLANSTYGAE